MPNQYNNPQNRSDLNTPLIPPEQTSYQQGYNQGQNVDNKIQYERERAAENSGAATGLVIGSVLTTLLGLGAVYYYWGRPEIRPTTIINNPSTPAASASAQPQKETNIIERTVEKVVPGETKIIEVPKPVAVPGETKVIEVPKPVAVPGETKVVEVPKTGASPVMPARNTNTPKTAPRSDSPKDSFMSTPSPAVSNSPLETNNSNTGAN